MKAYMNKKIFTKRILLSMACIFFILSGCKEIQSDESTTYSEEYVEEISGTESLSKEALSEEESHSMSDAVFQTELNGYEGEWYRTDVASYEWARIVISEWKDGESFDVTLDATYALYSGTAEGTAHFIDEDVAVLYDETFGVFCEIQEKDIDYGIYFYFTDNSIIVTHDGYLRMFFGGTGIATAQGTYVQGEPQYTNCTDVAEIYTTEELNVIKELLQDDYETLFEWTIESGKMEEYRVDIGRLWMAEYPPNGVVWCNILIYDDGSYFVEGRYWNEEYKFYTNTDATEMPDIENIIED